MTQEHALLSVYAYKAETSWTDFSSKSVPSTQSNHIRSLPPSHPSHSDAHTYEISMSGKQPIKEEYNVTDGYTPQGRAQAPVANRHEQDAGEIRKARDALRELKSPSLGHLILNDYNTRFGDRQSASDASTTTAGSYSTTKTAGSTSTGK